ncbi:MAG: hypothetical protein ACOCZC_03760 [Halodesulfurarchaeum sp.]
MSRKARRVNPNGKADIATVTIDEGLLGIHKTKIEEAINRHPELTTERRSGGEIGIRKDK